MSGRKFDAGKARYELLPPVPLNDLAALYTMGAEKYGDRNWEHGIAFGRLFSAMMRHAWAWWRGEQLDPDDGQPHLGERGVGRVVPHGVGADTAVV